MNLLEDMTN